MTCHFPLRIWCETVSHETLVSPAVRRLLRGFGLVPVVAVRPPDLDGLGGLGGLGRLCHTLAEDGHPVVLWPMLGDQDGRWAGARNAPAFAAYVRVLLERLGAAGAPVDELVLDLEPAFAEVRRLGQGRLGRSTLGIARAGLTGFAEAERRYTRLAGELRARGLGLGAAVVPLVLHDPPRRPGWQRLLGTPVDGLGCGRVEVMAYTSILEGWSRPWLGRGDARALLGRWSRAARERYGPSASVSLGAVGPGALGDEPTYRSVAELGEDVAIARAAGIERRTLFDLGGVLARPPAEAWLEAFVHTPPAAPPRTLKSDAGLWLASALGRLAAALPPS